MHKGIVKTILNKIWHKEVPFKMSLTWRAIIYRLLTNAKVAKLDISLSPTWYCCANHYAANTLKNAEHIFYAGEHAKKFC